MMDLQKTLRTLVRKNEELRMQAITWHNMFGREVRLREAMKRLLATLWWGGAGAAAGATGYSAHDVIVGLEAGEGGRHALALESGFRVCVQYLCLRLFIK